MKIPNYQYRCLGDVCNPRPQIWTRSRSVAGATSTSSWCQSPMSVWILLNVSS